MPLLIILIYFLVYCKANKYIEYCWIKARSQVPTVPSPVQIVSNSDNLESQIVISNTARPSLDCSTCDTFEGINRFYSVD